MGLEGLVPDDDEEEKEEGDKNVSVREAWEEYFNR